ncbi:MAG TPA: glycosyltransferase family 1 protein [Ktedonobacterales bacterium]|nr:glycosyltransferase family 1 protein [Ktedonobacterales bacterium]
MRIGINALLVSAAQSYRNAGISRYTLGLLRALNSAESTHEYSVFVSTPEAAKQVPITPSSGVVVVGRRLTHPARRVLWEQVRFAGEIRTRGLQLLHAPMNILPARLPCPGIITIHDLAFLRFPQFFRPTRRAYQQFFTPRSARRAALIIAVSEHTRQDIIELLNIPEERVRVIYPILEERLRLPCSAETIQAFRQRQQLPEHFILFLATLEPRKNIPRLLEAYRLLKEETHLPHTLVLAGAKGWYAQTLEQQVHTLGIQNDVRFVGYVPEDEKMLWYHTADLFVYPSLYEGFGLPVAEAMACGLPVVTSNASSLPEVVGDDGAFGERAALMANPNDIESLARTMQQGLCNNALRQQCRIRGLGRSQRFAPAPVARQIMQAYQDAVSGTL